MNRDQKAAAIAQIASHIDESQAIFAVDYRGITVAQLAELRVKLRETDATFKVVKNSLTERAADQAGADTLKEFLSGPTALTFVRGDAATAAKAVADYARATQLLPFKGGLMDGAALDVDQIRSLSRLPARDVLYGQLVGVIASPVSGLVRTLNALLGGLAVALGQVHAKKESGELPAGQAPASADSPAGAGEASASADSPAAGAAVEGEAAAAEAPAADAPAAEATADQTEPAQDEPAPTVAQGTQADHNQADVSAQAEPEDAETTPKED